MHHRTLRPDRERAPARGGDAEDFRAQRPPREQPRDGGAVEVRHDRGDAAALRLRGPEEAERRRGERQREAQRSVPRDVLRDVMRRAMHRGARVRREGVLR